ncbi:MAG: nicotinate-nucleotide adenylyltransferase [Cytophagales bacterium]|nr:nicotinate-nucleotide adenylyltransferase [Cytophagales bacterium]
MKVGLFFGSFNPIHIGHLVIANTIVEESDLDEVCFVVSPQNPFKQKKSLLHEFDRYDLVSKVIKGNKKLAVSDIEFGMPKPSYTIDTLAFLQEKFPMKQFSIIMGADNVTTLHKWKNYEEILANHEIYVYPRPFAEAPIEELQNHPKIHHVEAPIMEISATRIRKSIQEEKSIQYLVPDPAIKYIKEKGFYL